jgi:triosephosphate isomerase
MVAGNWKMNLTGHEGAALVDAFIEKVRFNDKTEVVVCPPYLAMSEVRKAVKDTEVKLGAQDVFWKEKGAFTGNVSSAMLSEYGVKFCIVGHSETRGRFGKVEVPETTLPYFGENDETVNLKIKALIYEGICPILCVGETLSERESNQTDVVIKKQLEGALQGVDGSELDGFVVAYEPVWAIGTGKTCDTPEANRVCGMIRSVLAELYDQELADKTRVLYGGSVKPDNATELFKQEDIDGGLVGGASLKSDDFARIISA